MIHQSSLEYGMVALWFLFVTIPSLCFLPVSGFSYGRTALKG